MQAYSIFSSRAELVSDLISILAFAVPFNFWICHICIEPLFQSVWSSVLGPHTNCQQWVYICGIQHFFFFFSMHLPSFLSNYQLSTRMYVSNAYVFSIWLPRLSQEYSPNQSESSSKLCYTFCICISPTHFICSSLLSSFSPLSLSLLWDGNVNPS